MSSPTLDAIAVMTAALESQEDHDVSTATSRVSLIRAARAEGHSLEEIGAVAGITRQRVGQLLERSE